MIVAVVFTMSVTTVALVIAGEGDGVGPATGSEAGVVLGSGEGVPAGILAVLETSGAKAAVAAYEKMLTDDPERAYGCHSEAHLLGQNAAMREDPRKVVLIAPGLCQGGFLHGVLQVAAREKGYERDICSNLPEEYIDNCAHGYGHLLAVQYPRSISEALQVCIGFYDAMVSTSIKLVARCGGGAAMEYGTAVGRSAGVLAVDPEHSVMGPAGEVQVELEEDELRQPCRVLQEFAKKIPEVQNECLLHVAFFLMREANAGAAELYAACIATGNNTGEREVCLRSVGQRLVEERYHRTGETEGADLLDLVRSVCGEMPESGQQPCAVGGYRQVISQEMELLSSDCLRVWQTPACREAQYIVKAEQLQ